MPDEIIPPATRGPRLIQTYLGDGLYANFDGVNVVLTAPRENGHHWVALEPETMVALQRWLSDLARDHPPIQRAWGFRARMDFE